MLGCMTASHSYEWVKNAYKFFLVKRSLRELFEHILSTLTVIVNESYRRHRHDIKMLYNFVPIENPNFY